MTQAVPMTEAELLLGLTQALEIAGWRWTHIRRSDGITVGDTGLPDILAVHDRRGLVLAWELKSASGVPTPDQVAWIHGFQVAAAIDARLVRPKDYDQALDLILGRSRLTEQPRDARGRPVVACTWCGGPTRDPDPDGAYLPLVAAGRSICSGCSRFTTSCDCGRPHP